MKKLLAAILAAAMTLSLGITAFAAGSKGEKATMTLNLTGAASSTTSGDVVFQLTVKGSKVDLTLTSKQKTLTAGPAASDIAPLFAGAKADGFTVTDTTLAAFVITADEEKEYDWAVGTPAVTLKMATVTGGVIGNYNALSTPITSNNATATLFAGENASYGTSVDDIVEMSTPLVESKNDLTNEAFGKDLTLKSGKAVFFKVVDLFANPDEFEITVKKSSNARCVKAVSVVETVDTYYAIDDGAPVSGGGVRASYIKVELNDNYTDKEFKLSFDVTAKAKVDVGNFKKGDKSSKFTSVGKFWMQNRTETADQSYDAGEGGLMLKPVKNEDNEIIWNDANHDLARLTFVSDDNAAKFFPKLSTKWEDSDYAELFADQNAFYFDFVGNLATATQISSTSRATLELYNPYYDQDEDTFTVEPTEVVIYQVAADGTFTDVSDQFTVGENDDGDSVYTTKTRELGTYIFAEKVLAATEEEVEAPAKEVPNTGR